MQTTLIACATCAANNQSDGNNAAAWSILFLLGVIVAMLAGVALCMVRIARRQGAELDPELHDG